MAIVKTSAGDFQCVWQDEKQQNSNYIWRNFFYDFINKMYHKGSTTIFFVELEMYARAKNHKCPAKIDEITEIVSKIIQCFHAFI